MKQREEWKAKAPVRARSTARSPSGAAFLAVQILQTSNSVLSVKAKAKTGARVKASVKKTVHADAPRQKGGGQLHPHRNVQRQLHDRPLWRRVCLSRHHRNTHPQSLRANNA
eukprot:3640902-Rhodomonas_salina.1